MVPDLTYKEFCNKFYLKAKNDADVAVANFIKENGQPHRSIDLDLVKDKAVELGLMKTYNRFDSDNEKAASVKTFLSTIVCNQVLTNLRDEGRAVGADKSQSLDTSFSEGNSQIEDNSSEASQKRLRVAECISRLDPIDQVIINCWMENSRTYCDDVLSQLGWDGERRKEVKSRKKKAFVQLSELLKEYNPNEETNTSCQSSEKGSSNASQTDSKRILPSKALYTFSKDIDKYFGFFSRYEEVLDSYEDNLDSSFVFQIRVDNNNIETVFDTGRFNFKEETKETYLVFLWLVANMYHREEYDEYKDSYIYNVEYENLVWNAVREDILGLYVFMQDHKGKAPITIKMDGDTVTILDTDKWFHALLEKHLFPKCLPRIRSKEQAINDLTRPAGRKVKDELATAIIVGLARFFSDEGLINGRAPINLRKFIKEYLLLMGILDQDGSVVSEARIKSTIDYAIKQGIDTRLPSRPPFEKCSEEDLTATESEWLYKTE